MLGCEVYARIGDSAEERVFGRIGGSHGNTWGHRHTGRVCIICPY